MAQFTTVLYADVAQLAEQLICNQQVIGSIPIVGSFILYMGGFPSGQRGQTVNLLQIASMVRIHLHPLSYIDETFCKVIEKVKIILDFHLYTTNAG